MSGKYVNQNIGLRWLGLRMSLLVAALFLLLGQPLVQWHWMEHHTEHDTTHVSAANTCCHAHVSTDHNTDEHTNEDTDDDECLICQFHLVASWYWLTPTPLPDVVSLAAVRQIPSPYCIDVFGFQIAAWHPGRSPPC